MPASEPGVEGQRLATRAEVLYLMNLLLIPGLGFALLALLYLKHRDRSPPLAAQHLRQTLAASLWAGALLAGVTGITILLGGLHNSLTWLIAIPWFVTCHATFILLGVIGLTKAMAGKPYRYPLIGPRG